MASLFKYLFEHLFLYGLFFGLILASIYFVGKESQKWSLWNVVILLLGASTSFSLSFISPTSQNENLFYVLFVVLLV